MKREYITEGGVVHDVYTHPDGTKQWYVEGKLHREGGPAVIDANGTREWYVEGKLHREGGPAVIDANGTREWWVEDERIDHSLWGVDGRLVFSSVEVKL